MSRIKQAQKALDTLALALVAHGHVWTPAERRAYERATALLAKGQSA